MNVFKVLFFSFLVVATTGCVPVKNVTGGTDAKSATEVTLAQLKEATKEEPYFFYCGSDTNYNYFWKGKEGIQHKPDWRFFRVSSGVKLPAIQGMIDDFGKRQIEPGKIGVTVHFSGDAIEKLRLGGP